MLQVNNLEIINLKDLKILIKNLSFTINAGDKIAIIGDEGTGKSSILKWLMKEEVIYNYLSIRGSFSNTFATQYLPQSIDKSFLHLKPLDYIGDIDYSIFYNLLNKIGLSESLVYSDVELKKLSGGEKIKLSLIKALMARPDLLLLDEPSNDLDLNTVYWLENFIKNSQLAILFISHDVELLKNTAKGIIHLGKKSTFAPISYNEYMERLEDKYEKDLRIGKKQRSDYARKMDKFRQIYQKVESAQNKAVRNPEAGRLLAKKMHSVLSQGRRFEREKENFIELPEPEDRISIKLSNYEPLPSSKLVFTLKDFELKIDDKSLSKKINLDFYGTDKIGIVGKNGVGKTSFFRCLLNLLKNRRDLRLGLMPQDYTEILDLKLTPLEFLRKKADKDELTKIMTYLSSMKFSKEEISRPMDKLSHGQRAKVVLTKLDLDGANVILLDEPTRNLSPLSCQEINKVFCDFKGALLAISHDRSFLSEVCHKIYELSPSGLKKI